MKSEYEALSGLLVGEAPIEEVTGATEQLAESALYNAEETDSMSYMLKFEEFIDDCGVYTFKGWEDASVLGEPKIEKFWVTVDLVLGPDADLRAALLLSGPDRDAVVRGKKDGDGYFLRIMVLRNVLDRYEQKNRKEAEQNSLPKVQQ